MELQQVTHIDNVRLSDDGTRVVYIDQTQLPNRTIYKETNKAEELFRAIYELQVRGAPCIGIFAAYALYVLALQIPHEEFEKNKANDWYFNSEEMIKYGIVDSIINDFSDICI